jgi:transcriptional antiterminator RfaH
MNLWYVIQTKPKKEEEARNYLSNKGVEIFAPRLEEFRFKNGKIYKEQPPLFPGYIFGKFDLMENFPLVRWGKGVKCVLGFGSYPVPIAEEVITVIRERTDERNIVKMKHDFKPNDVIRIKTGPLKDLLGIFDRWVSENDRVRVLLNLIGYQPAAELHYSMLEKVA